MRGAGGQLLLPRGVLQQEVRRFPPREFLSGAPFLSSLCPGCQSLGVNTGALRVRWRRKVRPRPLPGTGARRGGRRRSRARRPGRLAPSHRPRCHGALLGKCLPVTPITAMGAPTPPPMAHRCGTGLELRVGLRPSAARPSERGRSPQDPS